MSKLSQAIIAEHGMPRANSHAGMAMRKKGIERTSEFVRIAALERRVIQLANVPDLTPAFLRPTPRCVGCRLCRRRGEAVTPQIWPVQSAALLEMEKAGGLLGIVGVGNGKTLIDLLAVDALDGKVAVILVKPDLRDQMLAVDIPMYSRHFRLPLDRVHVVAYTTLQSTFSGDVLDKLNPDVIIADEAHCLANFDAVRTRRFRGYFKERPATSFAALSGTITNRTIKAYAHLLELALGAGSPVPRTYVDLSQWAEVIDNGIGRMAPGTLQEFCAEGESIRQGYRRRLIETPGVISVEGEGNVSASLVIAERKVVVPASIDTLLDAFRRSWLLADEEYETGLDFARIAKQIASGFHYRWVWPNGVKDLEWIEARKQFHKARREFLKYRARPGLDSPALLEHAAERWRIADELGYVPCGPCGGRAGEAHRACGGTGRITTRSKFEEVDEDPRRWACPEWEPWRAIKDRFKPHPPTETVWLSSFLVDDAVAWGREVLKGKARPKNGIIWYEHVAFGAAVAKAGGFPLFADGESASREILQATPATSPVIVASRKAHGTGKNLQSYCNGYLANMIPSGRDVQQLLGRLHRPGQDADEVRFDIPLHTTELLDSFDQACIDADYLETTTGQRQKLNYATKIVAKRSVNVVNRLQPT